ncbi:MAG TPA: helix-turn-helix domain-containing protein [Armatimonadota bacterium]|nr:helix-turn-helix domain-containing protein [Armatimonadota bacterium]
MSREDFANWLREEMACRGWDQSELTRRANLTTGVLSRILSLEREPSPKTLRAIARAFQIPSEDVFRRAGLLPHASAMPEGAAELLMYYRSAREEDRRRMLRVVRALYETGIDR